MSNFRATMDVQSKKLVEGFSLPESRQPFRYCGANEELSKMWGEFVSSTAAFDVKCDLTFRQVRIVMSPPLLGSIRIEQEMFLTEALAVSNISQFCERMNTACYRKSYKRYNKRLSVVSAIEGGFRESRFLGNGNGAIYAPSNTRKRIHAHLLLSRPIHIPYKDFQTLIIKNWIATRWGYVKCNIEQIKSVSRAAKYGVKLSLDSLDLQNTFFNEDREYAQNAPV